MDTAAEAGQAAQARRGPSRYPMARIASHLPTSELLEHTDGAGVAAFLSPDQERRSAGWRWLRPRIHALKAFGAFKSRDFMAQSNAGAARGHPILTVVAQIVEDGKLTMLKLCALLPHTEHEGFLEWLMKDCYHEEGSLWDYHTQLQAMNADADHTMDFEELVVAVQSWLEAGSPGLSVPRDEKGDDDQDEATIWVGNLPACLAALPDPEQALAALFSSFGEVQKVTVRKKDGDKSWSLLTLESAEKARAAAAAAVTYETARLKVELVDVQEHLKRPQTKMLAGVYEQHVQHVQQDHRPALAHFMNKVATRGRPEALSNLAAMKRWKWLKLRTQTIAALGGFNLASSEAKRQILTSAARRLNGFVRRSGLARSLGWVAGLEKLFDMLDEDNSGKVNVDEFRSGVRRVIGLSFDNQTIDVMVKHMDEDGDGEVRQMIGCAVLCTTLYN